MTEKPSFQFQFQIACGSLFHVIYAEIIIPVAFLRPLISSRKSDQFNLIKIQFISLMLTRDTDNNNSHYYQAYF